MSSVSACFATVLRLTRSLFASPRPRHAVGVHRAYIIPYVQGRGHLPPSFPGGLAKVAARGNRMARAAPLGPGHGPLDQTAQLIVTTVLRKP